MSALNKVKGKTMATLMITPDIFSDLDKYNELPPAKPPAPSVKRRRTRKTTPALTLPPITEPLSPAEANADEAAFQCEAWNQGEPEPAFDPRGKLETVEDVNRFVRAGNATITLVSRRTQTRFTFKIIKPEESRGRVLFFVKVLSGPDNENSYSYMGAIKSGYNGDYFTLTGASKVSAEAQSFKAFKWFWQVVVTQRTHPTAWGLDVWHEGRCCRCGRKLTVPSSVAQGMGDDCAAQMGFAA